ncbi:hypothetical protein MY1884_001394 [Beauveria asiatica]
MAGQDKFRIHSRWDTGRQGPRHLPHLPLGGGQSSLAAHKRVTGALRTIEWLDELTAPPKRTTNEHRLAQWAYCWRTQQPVSGHYLRWTISYGGWRSGDFHDSGGSSHIDGRSGAHGPCGHPDNDDPGGCPGREDRGREINSSIRCNIAT